MSFERLVAVRHLSARRKGLFAAVTTLIGVGCIALGTAAPIVVLSVMNGFQADIQKKIIGAQSHILVYGNMGGGGLGRLESLVRAEPEVAATAPFALGQAIVAYRGRATGVLLRGLDPAAEPRVNDLAKALVLGSWEPPRSGKPFIVLGEELSRGLGARVGDEVVLISPGEAAAPLGLVPKMRKFRVGGILRTGYYEFDSSTAYADLADAAAFLGIPGGASGLQVRLRRLDDAEAVGGRLARRLGFDYVVRTFGQTNRTLFAALKLEKYVMFLIVTLIVLVAAFNIASNLILMGTEKLRDIGVLRAMGATPGQIRRIFLWEGLLMGGCGALLGLGLGLGLCWVIYRYPLVELPPDIYYLSRVPVRVSPRDLALVLSSALGLSVLATLYPSARAAGVKVVDAIRYG